MEIEWHQVEEFFASAEGHFVRIQPMLQGPGYSASMNHLNDEGRMETILIPQRNELGDYTTGSPFHSIDDAKAACERFLADHLATPPAQREARLMEMIQPKGAVRYG